MSRFLYFIGMLLLWSACKTSIPVGTSTSDNKHNNQPYKHVFRATYKDDVYVLMLFKDDSFIWCKNRAELISWGKYKAVTTNSGEYWALASFEQAMGQQITRIEEAYDSTVQGTKVESHVWNRVAFIGSWIGFPLQEVLIDGQPCIAWPDQASRADSIYTGTCPQVVQQTITLKGRNFSPRPFHRQKPNSNVFKIYYLGLRPGNYEPLSPYTALLNKKTLVFPEEGLIGQRFAKGEHLVFEELDSMPTTPAGHSSPEQVALSAYYQFSAAGRTVLLKHISFPY